MSVKEINILPHGAVYHERKGEFRLIYHRTDLMSATVQYCLYYIKAELKQIAICCVHLNIRPRSRQPRSRCPRDRGCWGTSTTWASIAPTTTSQPGAY